MKNWACLAFAAAALAACDQPSSTGSPTAPAETAPAETVPTTPVPAPQDPALNDQLRGDMVGATVTGCQTPYTITDKEQVIELAITGREVTETEQVLTVPATLKSAPQNLKADLKVTYKQTAGMWRVDSVIASTCAPVAL